MLSPITVFLKSPELGNVPNLDFEKEQVGLETVKDLGSKIVLDAFTCVECGRCQVNCPAWGAGKELNPKTIILQTQDALLAGARDAKLAEHLHARRCCGSARRAAPARTSARSASSTCRSSSARGAAWCRTATRPSISAGCTTISSAASNIWGLSYDQRQKFVDSAALEIFDPAKHDVLVWLGCAGAFEADFQKSLRSLFEILRARQVKFGVLSKERCNGDPAKRTGNEYMYQELANANIEDLKAAGPKKILTSCPHCVKTIGDDYRKFGYEVEIVHSAVFVEELTRDVRAAAADGARHRHLSRPLLPRALRREGRRAAGAAVALRRRRPGTGQKSRQPVLLRSGRRASLRRQGGGAGLAHQRRAVQAAPGHRGDHRRHGLPVLFDHAEGRADERARRQRRSVR